MTAASLRNALCGGVITSLRRRPRPSSRWAVGVRDASPAWWRTQRQYLHAEARAAASGPTAREAAAKAQREALAEKNRRVASYATAIALGVLGASYAAVPLYKVFCQVTGFGGTTQVADEEKAARMTPVEAGRLITVRFDGGTASTMPWEFRPAQLDVRVVPGETALAFYTARNPTKRNMTGVATYNVFPLKAGLYFNKIQCFCFEEQRLRAGEEIDMPVFFFLDPELLDDPAMDNVHSITLSYTFFKTGGDEEEDEGEDDGGDGEPDTIAAATATVSAAAAAVGEARNDRGGSGGAAGRSDGGSGNGNAAGAGDSDGGSGNGNAAGAGGSDGGSGNGNAAGAGGGGWWRKLVRRP
ncbi:unnamed protein product [Phaeothamnion confervicola]